MVAPRRPWASNIDMYRKVPVDLLEGSRRGSIMSTIAIIVMTTLFVMETRAFFRSDLATDLALDSNDETKVRVNFNITMMDMRCEFATIDVISVLETEQNVTQHVVKHQIDGEGVRQRYDHRNLKQHDIVMFDETVTETMEELIEANDGEYAESLDAQTLGFAMKSKRFLFVDFFASWCSHCRALAPTWETLAEVMDEIAAEALEHKFGDEVHNYSDEDYEKAKGLEEPVMITKVDCVQFPTLCAQQNIRAYPTLRLFAEGEMHADYKGHRTVMEMISWLSSQEHQVMEEKGQTGTMKKVGAEDVAWETMEMTDEQQQWNNEISKRRITMHHGWLESEHPGCEISGYLMVNRAPGNFRIQARSKHQEVNPYLANVSHEVHHLSFGDPVVFKHIKEGQTVTPSGFIEATKPIDGNVYVTKKIHEAHHHFLKVVTTNFKNMASKYLWNSEDYEGKNIDAHRSHRLKKNYGRAYQMLVSSKKSLYAKDVVPEAKFTYDLSPISVSYKKTSRRWYDYLTSLMAIIGGTFTFVGMMESGVHAVSSKKRR